MNQELPDFQAGFRKGRETRDQIVNIRWIIEKAKEFQKNIYFFFIDYAKNLWLCGSQLWKVLWNCGKFLERWEYQTTLPASWEICIQVKKQQLELDMEKQTSSKLGKEYIKAILSPCSFNLRAEYLMRNAGLDEAQAGIKIAGRNINNMQMIPPLQQKAKRN